MEKTNKDLYLDLIEKALTNTLNSSEVWSDSNGNPTSRKPTPNEIENGLYWPTYAHTMIGKKGMFNIRQLIESVIVGGVPGHLIETGVWRGGATIFMKAVLKANGINDRKVFVADSFQGLPPPDSKYPADVGDTHHTYDYLSVSADEVRENFKSYDLLDDNVVFVEGFFENSLELVEDETFAILRLDGDMYSSTIQVLEKLYDCLSDGGFVIIDDYSLNGCREAVDDFRRERGINDPLIDVDGSRVYWCKNGNLTNYDKPIRAKFIDQMRELGTFFETDKITHHHYENEYGHFLERFQNDKNSILLEIGTYRGCSVEMWMRLFPDHHIFGVDIDQELREDRVTIIKADQSSETDLDMIIETITDYNKQISFIIDDGSHVPEHQLLTFNKLFPILKTGGIYIIEDIETSYWTKGGLYGYQTRYGYLHPKSIVERFKSVVDVINKEFCPNFVSDVEHVNEISNVTFAKNCIILEKGEVRKDRPYRFLENL